MAKRSGSSEHVADRLIAAMEAKRAPVCVGLDPVVEKLPLVLGMGPTALGKIERFSAGVIEAVSPHVPAVKVQAACFERYGASGVAAMERIVARARQAGLVVILDAKRGDIGVSAEHYAAAVFHRPEHERADWITINSYLGEDGIRPFLPRHEGGGSSGGGGGGGAFALVRTSNPGGDFVQEAELAAGGNVADRVASMVAQIGEDFVGERGFSALGAVVGATKPEAAARLRQIMPRQIFLVPGYGAQGGGVDDVLPCFTDGWKGAIVTASRSVIYAFDASGSAAAGADWKAEVADAARHFADEIGRATGMR